MKFELERESGSGSENVLFFVRESEYIPSSLMLRFTRYGVELYKTSYPQPSIEYQPRSKRVKIIGVDEI